MQIAQAWSYQRNNNVYKDDNVEKPCHNGDTEMVFSQGVRSTVLIS